MCGSWSARRRQPISAAVRTRDSRNPPSLRSAFRRAVVFPARSVCDPAVLVFFLTSPPPESTATSRYSCSSAEIPAPWLAHPLSKATLQAPPLQRRDAHYAASRPAAAPPNILLAGYPGKIARAITRQALVVYKSHSAQVRQSSRADIRSRWHRSHRQRPSPSYNSSGPLLVVSVFLPRAQWLLLRLLPVSDNRPAAPASASKPQLHPQQCTHKENQSCRSKARGSLAMRLRPVSLPRHCLLEFPALSLHQELHPSGRASSLHSTNPRLLQTCRAAAANKLQSQMESAPPVPPTGR